MVLTVESLREVRTLLYPARIKWYSIGVELKLSVGELDVIKATYSDLGDCLIEMIKVWLKSIDSLPTWKTLADALRAEPVNELELAKKGIKGMLCVTS